MKRCPACQRQYADDSLSFCLEDGSPLVKDQSASSDLPATLIIPAPRITVPAKQDETFRPTPSPPQGYPAPHPAWTPVATLQNSSFAPAQQGKGVAVASLVCGIGA